MNESDSKINNAIVEHIKEKLESEKLKDLISKTSIIAWNAEMPETKINEWLQNFDGTALGDIEAEKKLALWILLHFVFYTDNEVRVLCKSIYNEYIHHKLIEYKSNGFLTKFNLREKAKYIIQNTLFIALGNDSESGANILYFFRQENKLPKHAFDITFSNDFENIVFIDDVTISGEQATKYIKKYNAINRQNTYLLTFMATKASIKHFSFLSKDIKLIHSILLDERAKIFSESSYVFSNEETKKIMSAAEKMCHVYGKSILEHHYYMAEHPLGFDNGQYLFGFYYNTPDNALPVIWCDLNGWKPAFKRYDKIVREEVSLHESIYL